MGRFGSGEADVAPKQASCQFSGLHVVWTEGTPWLQAPCLRGMAGSLHILTLQQGCKTLHSLQKRCRAASMPSPLTFTVTLRPSTIAEAVLAAGQGFQAFGFQASKEQPSANAPRPGLQQDA